MGSIKSYVWHILAVLLIAFSFLVGIVIGEYTTILNALFIAVNAVVFLAILTKVRVALLGRKVGARLPRQSVAVAVVCLAGFLLFVWRGFPFIVDPNGLVLGLGVFLIGQSFLWVGVSQLIQPIDSGASGAPGEPAHCPAPPSDSKQGKSSSK